MKTMLLGLLFYSFSLFSAEPPATQLAAIYQGHEAISEYLVSEKYDGVRAVWNGEQLLSRGGHVIHAPDWFTQGLPNVWLDGELWAGYKNFAFVSGVARRQQPNDSHWRQITYYIFDAPDKTTPFVKRYQHYKRLIDELNIPHIQAVEQLALQNRQALNHYYDAVLEKGAEGLMLHRKNALHKPGRSSDIVKYKPYQDAEAIVLKHLPGNGKYKGMMGSLLVKDERGKQFKIGTGFSDAERKAPPAVGSRITFRYQGYTKFGKPRFARFLRMRPAL